MRISVVGKYTDLKDSYKSLNEALIHGGIYNNSKVDINWVNAEKLDKEKIKKELESSNGILVPGGFGERGINGKIQSIRYARENNVPFFGICLGMQLAVVEIARNLLKIDNANSTEFSDTINPVVCLMTEWHKENVKILRNKNSEKGGTMRLGAYHCDLKENTLIKKIYNMKSISERHRHRYEVNKNYINDFEKFNFIFSGMSPDNLLPEIIESSSLDWFIGVQFHPELKSRPQNPHPLFVSFINACIKSKNEKN